MVTNSHMFYTVTLGFFFGIALHSFFHIGLYDALFALIVSSAFFVLYAMRREVSHLMCGVALCVIVLGIFRYEFADRRMPTDLNQFEGTKIVIEGEIIREPDRREKNTLLTVRVDTVDGESTKGTILVFHDRLSERTYGDRVIVEGVLKKPESFETEFGRSFDYPSYLKALGVSHTMQFGNVELISMGNGNTLTSALLSFKHTLIGSIQTVLTEPQSGLALGLLLGEKQALPKEFLASFRNAGVIHIVVLSGYNIAILIDALMRLLAFVTIRTRALVGGATIFLFVLMVGPSATVVRAAIMAGLVLLARMTGKTYAILRALIVAALVMLLWNPYLLLHDPGFQLSFLATLGLILIAPLIEQKLSSVPNTVQAKEFAVATIATQIMVLPILVYSIGTVSIVALIANVLILPAVPVAMLFSAIAGFLNLIFPTLGALSGYPAHLVLTYIVILGDRFGRLPFSAIEIPPFSFIWVFVSYAVIGIGLWCVMNKKVVAMPVPAKIETKSPAEALPPRDSFPFA